MARMTARMAGLAATMVLAALVSAHPAHAAGMGSPGNGAGTSSPSIAAGVAHAGTNTTRQIWDQPSTVMADAGGDLTPNQLTAGRTLTRAEAAAACGPAAAVAFARARGMWISLDAAVAAARAVGWTPELGMAGPASQVALLRRLGIAATIEAGVDRDKLAREVRAGRPVILRVGGANPHYLVAERVDAAGRFDFGQSALVLKSSAGRRWLALHELGSLGLSQPTHAIYLAGGTSAPQATTSTTLRTAAMGAATPLVTRLSAAAAAAAQSPAGSRVVETGGWGARLRAAPDIAGRVVGLAADGARLTDLGTSQVASGRTWRRVADATGTPAWIDASLLRTP